MDVLSDILAKVKLKSAIYFKSNFPEGWGMNIPKGDFAQFHIITKGQCMLGMGKKTLQLFVGDIVIFPFGIAHWLADDRESKLISGRKVVESITNRGSVFHGEKLATTLICGHFEFDRFVNHPFIKELPTIIHLTDTDANEFSWLKPIADLLIKEMDKKMSGNDIIINKLGEILFVFAMRAYIEKNTTQKEFVSALKDKRISKVLNEIHALTDKNLGIEDMAKIAGMSRTGFINRFKELTGTTPFNYLIEWRMIQAQELLKDSKLSVGEIADQIGYQSEAAFNRVFKKKTNLSPLKFRKQSVANVG